MLPKLNTRWHVENIAGKILLMQSYSKEPTAQFHQLDEAKWVANRLNHGRDLCVAVSNLVDNAALIREEPRSLVDDVLRALMIYKRSE